MKCISCRQPWAQLIVDGIKPVENRQWARIPSWEPQWLLIHSSQKLDRDSIQFLEERYKVDDCVCGAILGAALCSSIVSRKDLPREIRKSEFWNPDCNTFLVFKKAVKIEPVYCKGRLGFWNAPQEAIDRLCGVLRKDVMRCY